MATWARLVLNVQIRYFNELEQVMKHFSHNPIIVGILTTTLLNVVGCGDRDPAAPMPRGNNQPAQGEVTSLSFFLGDSRDDVHNALGRPQKFGVLSFDKEFDSYFNAGLSVEYRQDVVVEINATLFEESRRFTGKILGLSLGDPADHYIKLLGKPDKEVETEAEYSIAIWRKADYDLSLELWCEDGNLYPWGPFNKGDIKRITVTTERKNVVANELVLQFTFADYEYLENVEWDLKGELEAEGHRIVGRQVSSEQMNLFIVLAMGLKPSPSGDTFRFFGLCVPLQFFGYGELPNELA